MTDTGIARFDADATARDLRVEVVERPAADSLAEAAALLGIQPGDIVKTLVVKRHDGGFVLARRPGRPSIAWKKLRAVVGVNKLSMPDAATALEASGYERGTITPIGATGDLRCTPTSGSWAAASHWPPGATARARSSRRTTCRGLRCDGRRHHRRGADPGLVSS